MGIRFHFDIAILPILVVLWIVVHGLSIVQHDRPYLYDAHARNDLLRPSFQITAFLLYSIIYSTIERK